jgi:hypothetical protein
MKTSMLAKYDNVDDFMKKAKSRILIDHKSDKVREIGGIGSDFDPISHGFQVVEMSKGNNENNLLFDALVNKDFK